MITRRELLKRAAGASAAVLAAPVINRGRYRLFAYSPNTYSARAVELMKRVTVIDMIAQATGQPKLELFPESQTRFFVKEVAVQIEFVVDGSGKATSLILYQGGRQLPARKIK